MLRRKLLVPEHLKFTFDDLDRELAEYSRQEEEKQREAIEGGKRMQRQMHSLKDTMNEREAAEAAYEKALANRMKRVQDNEDKENVDKVSVVIGKQYTPVTKKLRPVTNVRSPTGTLLSRGHDLIASIFKYDQRKDIFERVVFKK